MPSRNGLLPKSKSQVRGSDERIAEVHRALGCIAVATNANHVGTGYIKRKSTVGTIQRFRIQNGVVVDPSEQSQPAERRSGAELEGLFMSRDVMEGVP